MKRIMTTNNLYLLAILCFLVCSGCSKESVDDFSSNGNFDSNLATSGPGVISNEAFGYVGEGYNEIEENPFIQVSEAAVSTFSIDADGASYSNARRFLNSQMLPPKDAIRTEELINYFSFDYPQPMNEHPIALNGEISNCPWNSDHKLLRIGLQGKDIPTNQLGATNFVFLIDVSGSMSSPNKLGILKESFKLFVDNLDGADKVAIVTYAGSAGVVLPSTSGAQNNIIKQAIDNLDSGGSTAGAEGIITAYEIAENNFIPGGNNRIILATDGDFNVGPSSEDELVALIEEKRESGVFLTVIGVGTGNLQDGRMEQIANHGNGNYEYIDNLEQAEKVFIHEFKKFYTVAKDVKIQIEFNQSHFKAYRLIGYENRLLDNPDFEDDTKDAGEIGSNQSITAIYELIPQPLPAQSGVPVAIDFRYKLPEEDFSIPINLALIDQLNAFSESSENMRFAAAVAAFGMLLRDSEYKGTATYDEVIDWAQSALGNDQHQYRAEFVDLVNIAKNL